MSCQNHKKDVAGFTNMRELAKIVSELHYETLNIFLDNLAVEIHKDGLEDFDAGRKKLGIALQNVALNLQKAKLYLQDAWEISKPFMESKPPQP